MVFLPARSISDNVLLPASQSLVLVLVVLVLVLVLVVVVTTLSLLGFMSCLSLPVRRTPSTGFELNQSIYIYKILLLSVPAMFQWIASCSDES